MNHRRPLALLVVLFACLLTGCREGTEFSVAQPFNTVVESLQRRLATTPGHRELQIRRMDSDHGGFTYLDGYGKTWARRVGVYLEGQGQEATHVIIRCERIDSGMFTSSSKRLPEVEQKVRETLFPPPSVRVR